MRFFSVSFLFLSFQLISIEIVSWEMLPVPFWDSRHVNVMRIMNLPALDCAAAWEDAENGNRHLLAATSMFDGATCQNRTETQLNILKYIPKPSFNFQSDISSISNARHSITVDANYSNEFQCDRYWEYHLNRSHLYLFINFERDHCYDWLWQPFDSHRYDLDSIRNWKWKIKNKRNERRREKTTIVERISRVYQFRTVCGCHHYR